MNLGIKCLMTTDITQKTTKQLNVGRKGPFLYFFGSSPVPPGIDIYAGRGGGTVPRVPRFLQPCSFTVKPAAAAPPPLPHPAQPTSQTCRLVCYVYCSDLVHGRLIPLSQAGASPRIFDRGGGTNPDRGDGFKRVKTTYPQIPISPRISST